MQKRRLFFAVFSVVGVVVEIALNVDDGGTLVAGAGGQVAQGADQVRQAAGGSALGDHVAHQRAAVLSGDAALDGLPQLLAVQTGEIVVRQVLQLQFVGRTLQTGGVGGGHHGVCQLPDLANGILEGTVASVPVEGTRKHREMETVQIDTRDILFICGGAFVGLADIVAQRLGARESGFGAAWHDHEVPKRELLAQVSADDLADFGLLPEFIGRLPVVSVLEELTEDDLARILVEPENALVKQYQKLFAVDGVTLTFTEGAIRQIAATSIRRGTGARGLRSIIEKTLEDTMFRLPSMEGVEEVVVDEAAVTGSGTPKLFKVSTQKIPRLREA